MGLVQHQLPCDCGGHITLKIPSADRCSHCGHWSGDATPGFRIVSEDRFKWMQEAVQAYYENGDEPAWRKQHKDLLKREE